MQLPGCTCARPSLGETMGTDRDWEKWGAANPYFGVFSEDRFRHRSLDDQARTAFFASGKRHVASLWRMLSTRSPNAEHWVPASCLDFGCGVGRLLLPFAERVNVAVGVDVSNSMLVECSKNVQASGLGNITLTSSLAGVKTQFSLVHSYIVFQHIPWAKGRGLLRELADRVAPEGCFAVQLLVSCQASNFVRALVKMRYGVPPLQWVWNLSRRRPVLEPPMQLNVYNFSKVADDLLAAGFGELIMMEEATTSGFRSSYVLAWRCARPLGIDKAMENLPANCNADV